MKIKEEEQKKINHMLEIDLNEEVRAVPGLKQLMEFESSLDNAWKKQNKIKIELDQTIPIEQSFTVNMD